MPPDFFFSVVVSLNRPRSGNKCLGSKLATRRNFRATSTFLSIRWVLVKHRGFYFRLFVDFFSHWTFSSIMKYYDLSSKFLLKVVKVPWKSINFCYKLNMSKTFESKELTSARSNTHYFFCFLHMFGDSAGSKTSKSSFLVRFQTFVFNFSVFEKRKINRPYPSDTDVLVIFSKSPLFLTKQRHISLCQLFLYFFQTFLCASKNWISPLNLCWEN